MRELRLLRPPLHPRRICRSHSEIRRSFVRIFENENRTKRISTSFKFNIFFACYSAIQIFRMKTVTENIVDIFNDICNFAKKLLLQKKVSNLFSSRCSGCYIIKFDYYIFLYFTSPVLFETFIFKNIYLSHSFSHWDSCNVRIFFEKVPRSMFQIEPIWKFF